MADFIISPYAISFNSIKNALQTYINDKNVSSVTDTWSDFYTAGAGQTILELDAAVAAFYAFHFLIGRRETYLPVAQNYSSIVGGAESLGYNSSRGHNVHVSFTIIPNTTRTLPRWSVVGSYAEYDIVNLDTVMLIKDTPVTIDCVIGNSSAQSITITSSEVQQFTFTAEDTTDDCRLILTDKEVPMSTELRDAVNDNYVVLTNPYGSVDVFYLNMGGDHVSYSVHNEDLFGWTGVSGNEGDTVDSHVSIYKDILLTQPLKNTSNFVYTGNTYQSNYSYSTHDILYFQYIQRNSLKYANMSMSTAVIDYGDITDMNLIEDFVDVQSKDSIKLAASIYHETNNVVRARKDFAKLLLQDNTLGLIDTNDHDINPGLIAVTYLKEPDEEGSNLLTTDEKEKFMEKVVKLCPDGVSDIYIEDPIPVIRTLSIKLWKKTDEVLPANLNDYIAEILNKYKNKLSINLDLEDVESALEEIPGVKIARASIGTKEYAKNTKYKLYDIVEIEDILIGTEYETQKFMCIKIQTKSGESEPDWGSAADIGQTVSDSNLLWEHTNKYVSSVPYRWKSGGKFSKYGDIAVGYNIYPNCTSYTQPTWDKVTVIDGNVTFNKIKTYDYFLTNWRANTSFDVDEFVLFNRENDYAVYKVTEKRYKTGNTEPDWTLAEEINDTVQDNAVTWTKFFKGYAAENEYSVGNTIGILIDGKIYPYVCSKACNSETIYANTQKTGVEEIPFDGSVQIKEWVEKEHTVRKIVGYDDDHDPIYKNVTEYYWEAGDIIWTLDENNIIEADEFSEWQAYTTFPVLTYTQGGNDFFRATSIGNSTTGEDWFSGLTNWPETYVDNNIVWELDSVTVGYKDTKIAGTTWLSDTEYSKGQVIIVHDNNYHYVYNVTHTNDNLITTNNVIYTVSTYTGTTGTTPKWYYTTKINGEDTDVQCDNVEDNDILWTKTTNTATKEYSEYTRYFIGDIISTDYGNFVFSSILGTSGDEDVDWTNIVNGVVEDGNISWQKIEDSTVLELDWNEYLELDYTLED